MKGKAGVGPGSRKGPSAAPLYSLPLHFTRQLNFDRALACGLPLGKDGCPRIPCPSQQWNVDNERERRLQTTFDYFHTNAKWPDLYHIIDA